MKKLLSICLALIIASNCFNVGIFAANETNSDIAEAILGQTLTQTGFSVIESGTSTTPNIVVRGNSHCWLLDRDAGTSKAYINFALNESFKYGDDGSVYYITVEYYDTGTGYFTFKYNSLDKASQLGEIVYMNNESAWKSVTFMVDDYKFANELEGKYDFQMGIKGTSSSTSGSTSSSSIGIRKVTVERKRAVNPIWVSSSSGRTGNAFEWFSDSKIIHNTYTNKTDKQLNVTVTHKFISDNESYAAFEKSEEMTFEPNEIKEVDFNFSEFDRCDVYNYYVEIKSDDGLVNSSIYTMPLAILKTDPNGIVEPRVQFNAHFSHTSDRLAHAAMWDILKLGNLKNLRHSAGWNDMESTKGSLAFTASQLLIYEDLKTHGFSPSPGGFMYSPTWVSGGLTLPYTEEELAGWERFIRYAITAQKDITDRYEIWNEPNITSFNKLLDERGPDVYMKAYDIAYNIIQEIDPGALVGGPSTTGIQYASGYNFWKECIEYGLADYENAAIVLHPYTTKPIETSGMIEDVLKHKNDFIKAGGSEDVELWHTEIGYTLPDDGVGTERMKGALNARSALAYYRNDAGDILSFYNLEKKGYIATDREDMFGSVGPKGAPIGKYQQRCIPTEAYVEMVALTYILAQAYIEENYLSDDGNLYLSKFNSEKFGNKIISMHTIGDAENVTLDLGANQVTFFDEYGNETEIYGNNGVFTFTVDNYPKYVMGDITKFNVLDTKPFIDYSMAEIIAAETDILPIEVYNHTNNNYTIELEAPDGIRVVENNGFVGNTAKILVENSYKKGEDAFVTVKVMDGDKVVQISKLLLFSSDMVTAEFEVSLDSPKDTSKWTGTLKIKNNSATKTLTGSSDFISEDMFGEIKDLNIGIIPPGRTGAVVFSLPKVNKKGQYFPHYNVTTSEGHSFEFTGDVDFTLAKYAETKPKIDGIVEDGEWAMDTAMYADNAEQVKNITDWTPDDISGKSVVMWDEDYFYLCSIVTDDKHVNIRPVSENWNGDNIQFGVFYGEGGFVAIGQANSTFHEISMSLSSLTNEVMLYRFLSQESCYPAGVITDAECVIKREGKQTIYEFKMPWKSLLMPGHQPKEGDMLGYSYLINESDSTTREGRIEYASGIGAAKDTSLFTYMTLLR